MNAINLQTLTSEMFEALCHALLFEEHGMAYRPVDGKGGDSGIDGYIEDYSIVYQFKFFTTRPRPAAFLKDIDKVAHLSDLKRWILIIPDDPTVTLYKKVEKEKTIRPFEVAVLGKTWLLSKLDGNELIRDRFFPKVAKEKSVQKIIDLTQARNRKADEHHKDIKNNLDEIKKKLRLRRQSISVELRSADDLTPQHIRDITDEIKRIENASHGKISYDRALKQLKNRYGVKNWHLIKDVNYGDIMSWLNRYFHGVEDEYKSPGQSRKQFQGIIKSQQRSLGLVDKEYRELLIKLTGKNSTTQMDIAELKHVKDQFNILLGFKL